MKKEEIKEILLGYSNEIAFVIGNGINLHFNQKNISWQDLLLDLWHDNLIDTKTEIPEGISFTEFYDALEIQNYEKKVFGSALQKSVKEKMLKWDTDNTQNHILNSIKDMDAPILTTNFDDLIPKSLKLDFRKIDKKHFTDYYPWSCYFGEKDLSSPTEGFGVWYMNGMIKYHRSIKLGLSQYMGNVARARKMIHDNPDNIFFEGKNKSFWPGYHTWLHIIFNKSLFVFGLGLDINEVFVRWLLIERAKYFRRYPKRKRKGWFLTTKQDDSETFEGKEFFLRSVGFEVIQVDDYKTIYEDIWINL